MLHLEWGNDFLPFPTVSLELTVKHGDNGDDYNDRNEDVNLSAKNRERRGQGIQSKTQ
jgi:hypothetical protein